MTKNLPEFVVGHLSHNPCGPKIAGGTKRKCWIGGKCKAKMPRDLIQTTDAEVDGYALYRRRLNLQNDNDDTKMPTLKKFVRRENKDGSEKKKGGRGKPEVFDSRWIPGYNPALLMKYRCHINVEFCGSIKAINYLYKYIYKGTDCGYMRLKQYKEQKDEIYLHKYGRILTANESHYRLAGFKRGELYPSVTRLGFFVPGKKSVLVKQNEIPDEKDLQAQIEKTPYWKWFQRNKLEYELFQEYQDVIGKVEDNSVNLLYNMKKINKEFGYDVVELLTTSDGKKTLRRTKDSFYRSEHEEVPLAFELNYEDFGRRYTFASSEKRWKRRSHDEDAIVRLYMGYPGTEYFYLRKLLRARKGPLCVEDLLVDPEDENNTWESYKEACVALGLVDSSKEYFLCMSEAQDMGFSNRKLLGLFSQMIICGEITNIGEI